MAQKIGEFSFGINFEVNTKQLEAALDKIRNLDASKMGFTGLDSKQIQEIKNQALEVQKAMSQAFDPKTNTYSFDKFEAALRKTGKTAETIAQNFAKIGATGHEALFDIAKQLTTTNVQLKQSHALLEKMATTLANTIRWQVATKAIQGMTGAIQQGYYFTKDLDKSLNNIRIVTDKSAASMDKFAVKAAAAAKELGKSTTDYTNASLIYYQQGLGDEEVAKRTETTLKAANVTGQSAAAVSEELTAVWNGFQVSLDETESSIDKLAAVAANSASNLEEISTAMSKVAATANMTGVTIDQLTAQIATIESVTRQSPETIGTALKTIYARMSDLKLGETDEDGVSLGTVSGTLDSMGVHILDATGQLRDMGTVIEEVAEKWQYLGKEQQTALAESLGGKRQYTNLVALFENWDKYNASLKISQESLGTLQKQQNTYMDSIKAAEQRFATAKEQMQMALWDDDSIKDVNNALASITEHVTTLIKALGGGEGVLRLVSVILAQAMSPKIAESISTFANNAKTFFSQKDITESLQKNQEKFRGWAEEAGAVGEDASQYAQNRIDVQKAFIDGKIDKKERDEILRFLDSNIEKHIELTKVQQDYKNVIDNVNKNLKDELKINEDDIQSKDSAMNKIKEQIKLTQEEISQYEDLIDIANENGVNTVSIKDVSDDILNNINRDAELENNARNKEKGLLEQKKMHLIKDKNPKEEEIKQNWKKETQNINKEEDSKIKQLEKQQALQDKGNKKVLKQKQSEFEQQYKNDIELNEQKRLADLDELKRTNEINKAELERNKIIKNQDVLREVNAEKERHRIQIEGHQKELADIQSKSRETEKKLEVAKQWKKELEEAGIDPMMANEEIEIYSKELKLLEEKEKKKLSTINGLKTKFKNQDEKLEEEKTKALNNEYTKQTTDLKDSYEERKKIINAEYKDKEEVIKKSREEFLKGLNDERIANEEANKVEKDALEDLYKEKRRIASLHKSEDLQKAQEERQEEINAIDDLIKQYEEERITIDQLIEKKNELLEKNKKLTNAMDDENSEGIGNLPDTGIAKLNKKISDEQLDDFMDLINNPDKIKAATDKVTGLFAAFQESKIAQNALGELGTTGDSLADELTKIGTAAGSLVSSFTNVFTAFGGGLQGLIAGGIVTAFNLVKGYVEYRDTQLKEQREKVIKEAQEETKIAQEKIQQEIQETEQIQELSDAYKDLSNQYLGHNVSLEELRSKTYELLKQYGKESEAVQALTADYDELNELMSKTTYRQNQDLINTYNENLDKATSLLQASDNKAKYKKGSEDIDYSYYILTETPDAQGRSRSTRSVVANAVSEFESTTNKEISTYDGLRATYFDPKKFAKLFEDTNFLKDNIDSVADLMKVFEENTDLDFVQHVYEQLDEDTRELIQQLQEETKSTRDAEFQNKVTDILGYQWEKYTDIASSYDKVVQAIKKSYPNLTKEQIENKVEELYHTGGKDIEYQRYMLESASKAFQDAYDNIGGSLASDEDVTRLYHLFKKSNGTLIKNVIDLAMSSIPQSTDVVNTLAQEYAENQQFTEENLENLFNSAGFIDWLENNTELTIEKFKELGSEIRDSYITDYLAFYNLNFDDEQQKNISAHQKAIDEANKELAKLYKAPVNSAEDAKKREANIKELTTLINEETEALEREKAATSDSISKIQSLNSQFEKHMSDIDDIQSAYSTMTDIVETYNETGHITLDQLQSLMQMDGKYLQYLFDENGQLQLNEEAMQGMVKAKLAEAKANIVEETHLKIRAILLGESTSDTYDAAAATAIFYEKVGDTSNFEKSVIAIQNWRAELQATFDAADKNIQDQVLAVEQEGINKLRGIDSLLDMGNIFSSGIADSAEKTVDSLEDELDIYHDINVELGKIEKAYSRLEKQREKLVGQELYNSYQEELDLLTAQNDALERKQKLQMEEAERMRNELSAVGVAFDANGEVANYNQILTSWGDQVRANPEDETLKENYDKMKSLLQEYETLWDETIPEVADQIVENSTKQIEAQINKFNFKINLKVTLKDFDREWNDFQKEYLDKVQESDYAKQIESIIKNMQLSYDALGDTTDHLSEINREVEKLKNGAISDIYKDNKALALEDLETYLKNLEDLIKEVTEDLVNANEQYKASVDALAESFEKQISNLERLNSNYENQIKLAQLMLGEGGAAEEVTKLYEKQSAILQDQAQRLTAEGKYWENEINDIQNKLNSDDLTAESRNNLETMLEEATERMIAANEKAGAAYVSSVEAAQNAMLQNAQAQVNKLSEKVFGTQINAFKLAWEAAKEESEDTLDNIERAYETSQLNAKYTKLINDADLATKQKILNAQREMNERLEEQTELTKDDFEYENKKYELLVAEQQLEDARLNKNTLRLSRDSQGNYSYQYIADADGVSEAEDKVAQLEYELYELSKSQYYDGINQLLDRFENLPQKIQELGIALEQLTNSGASEEEIATLQGVYDTYVKQLENSTKKVNKSAVRGEETTVNALLKIAQSDNARLLIGGVDYEANRVELEKLANSDILSMYQMMIDDKSLAQNLYDNRYKLEQAGLRDWIELEVLDANFFNWSDMNERIQVNNGEVVLVLEEQEQNFADACKELQENIREYNNKTNELILKNEAKAVDAYNEVEDAIGDVITKTDSLVTSLTEEADAAKDAWTNIETLAQKYSTLAHNAGVAAAQAAELYKQLQLANQEAAKTPEDYGVGPGDSNGSLPGGNESAEKNKSEINTSIKDKIAGGDTSAGLYQAANATANRQLGINVNTNDTQTNTMSQDKLKEAFQSQKYKFSTWYADQEGKLKDKKERTYYKNDLSKFSYSIYTPIIHDSKDNKYYPIAIRDENNNVHYLGYIAYKTLKDIYTIKKGSDKGLSSDSMSLALINPAGFSFNTGGYTGEWLRGDRDGKLAFLHQKELVLNAEDTKNLLDTVRINREMMQMQLAAAAIQSQTPAAFTSNKALDQNVHIEANFPNVTNHTEVETALMNLVNYASQQVSIV